MKKIINIIYMNILYLLPKKTAHKILYFKRTKKKLNFHNLQNINEKIQWLIVNEYGKKEAVLSDKILVKDKIKNIDRDLNIPKILGIFNSAEEIDFKKLPEKFVLKTNHGCGDIYIFDGKNKYEDNLLKEKINKSLKKDFSKTALEYHYSLIHPKIFCEELLIDNNNSVPIDYKFYCFNGFVKCVLVCTDRVGLHKNIFYYDLNWKKLDWVKDEYKNDLELEKPKNFEKMIEIASKLSKGHKFVRVDLYNIDGKIYFGELTFTPACGMIFNIKDDALIELGNCLDLGLKDE